MTAMSEVIAYSDRHRENEHMSIDYEIRAHTERYDTT